MYRFAIINTVLLSALLAGCTQPNPRAASEPNLSFGSEIPTTDKGKFEKTPPRIEPDEDSEYFVLKETFAYIDPKGVTWTAPVGTRTDGASIPQIFLSLVGDRFDPRYRNAALVHDAYCQDINKGMSSYQSRPWEDVHSMFYDASIANGVDENKALLMFAAVWLGGPRWGDKSRSLKDVPPSVLKEELAKCKEWLEKEKRTRKELIAWMDKREPMLRNGVSAPM